MMPLPFENDLTQSLETLSQGGVILYPTDTVWGLGCDATRPTAVEKIYRIKRRVESKSMIVLVDSFEHLTHYVKQVPDITEDLLASINTPVTVIYSHAIRLASNVIATDGTVGIRIPDDAFCRELIRRFGKPVVSTSANISGEESPALFGQVSAEIKKEVDYIVRHKQDDFTRSKPSMIIRLQDDGSYTILRK